MDNHDSPWIIMIQHGESTGQSYVGLYFGHEHASDPSKSNEIGTSRIPVQKSIDLNGQNMVLT